MKDYYRILGVDPKASEEAGTDGRGAWEAAFRE